MSDRVTLVDMELPLLTVADATDEVSGKEKPLQVYRVLGFIWSVIYAGLRRHRRQGGVKEGPILCETGVYTKERKVLQRPWDDRGGLLAVLCRELRCSETHDRSRSENDRRESPRASVKPRVWLHLLSVETLDFSPLLGCKTSACVWESHTTAAGHSTDGNMAVYLWQDQDGAGSPRPMPAA